MTTASKSPANGRHRDLRRRPACLGVHSKQLTAETRVFQRAVERAGLRLGTSSHDLRHYYASVLLAAGESVIAVAERLGHEDASPVLSTYGHLMADSEDKTRKAIDSAWCGPGVSRTGAPPSRPERTALRQ